MNYKNKKLATNKIAMVSALLLSLSSCGFQPLYSTNNEQEVSQASKIFAETAMIKIDSIADRNGQILKNELLELLTPNGEPNSPKYRLKVTLGDFPSIKQGLQSDNTASRILINASAKYSLYNADDIVQPILTGTARAKTSYNVLDDTYSSIVSKETAERRALGIIAEDISLRLGVYFNTK
jgi:hypothetical protein